MKEEKIGFVFESNRERYVYVPENMEEVKKLREDLTPKTLPGYLSKFLLRALPTIYRGKTKLADCDCVSGYIGIRADDNLVCFIITSIKRKPKKSEVEKYISSLLNGLMIQKIDADAYRKLKDMANKEGAITSLISNGFTIYRKYVIYGKKLEEKVLIPPFYIKKYKKESK